MRKYSKVFLLSVLVMITLCVVVSGCNLPFLTSKVIKTSFDVGVQVVDSGTGAPVPGAMVYFAACNPNNKDARNVSLSNATDGDGWAMFSAVYDMNEGDVVYLGASTAQTAIEVDLAGRNFNGSGSIGAWKSFDYDMVNNSQTSGEASINLGMVVDRSTGKLLG